MWEAEFGHHQHQRGHLDFTQFRLAGEIQARTGLKERDCVGLEASDSTGQTNQLVDSSRLFARIRHS